MIFVNGQCYDVRLAILDGALVVADPIPAVSTEPVATSSPVKSPQLRSLEQSLSSSSGDSSFTKISAIKVSDESDAGSEYSLLLPE